MPKLHEGFLAMYEDASTACPENEELKIFQGFLKLIPHWSDSILKSEVKRILETSDCGAEILTELIEAVIRSNIMILGNISRQEVEMIMKDLNINLEQFVHNCYIESARMIYNNPYLYYHKYSFYEKKNVERKAQEVIKISIVEAIRKMLPLKIILKKYLGKDIKDDKPPIDLVMSEVDVNNLNHLLKNKEKLDLQPILNPDIKPEIIKEVSIKREPSPKRDSVKKEPSPKRDSIKKEPSPKRDSVKKYASPKRDSIKKEPSPKRDSVKKVPSPKRDSIKKYASPKRDSIKKYVSPKKDYPLEDSMPYYKQPKKIEDTFSNKSFNPRNIFLDRTPVDFEMTNDNYKADIKYRLEHKTTKPQQVYKL
jgi:hypothetical protein